MKLLKVVSVVGAPWKVFLTTVEEMPEIVGKQGITHWADQAIYINDDETSEDAIPFVVAHELGHVSIFMCGGKDTLRVLTGFKGKRFDDLEEFIVGTLVHSFYDTLQRNGWVNIQVP